MWRRENGGHPQTPVMGAAPASRLGLGRELGDTPNPRHGSAPALLSGFAPRSYGILCAVSTCAKMPNPNKLQNPYLVTVAVGVLYLVLLVWLWGHFKGDPLGFVHRGTVFSEGNPAGTRGYDGQFYYYIATDPLNAAQHMDNPAFRLQRVFYPLVIMAVSLGQAALVPYAMILINYLSVLGGTLLVGLMLVRW